MQAFSRRDARFDGRQRLGRNRRSGWLDELATRFKIAVVDAAIRSLRNGMGQTPARATTRMLDGRRLQRLRTLRKAIEWEIQLETGQVASRAAIAKREGISRAAVTQTLRLLETTVTSSAANSAAPAASHRLKNSAERFGRVFNRGARMPDHVDGRGYRELRKEILRRFESEYLPRVLRDAENNISTAATMAGIDRKHLWRLLRRNGIR